MASHSWIALIGGPFRDDARLVAMSVFGNVALAGTDEEEVTKITSLENMKERRVYLLNARAVEEVTHACSAFRKRP